MISKVGADESSATLTVGFLGLGIMGSPMAQNLLKAGYNVTIWNRTKSKCHHILEYEPSPAEVAASCDVTFAMLADPQSAVNASTVDAATSKLISKHIKDKGALIIFSIMSETFLQAPVSGSKKPAEDGQLIFLAAVQSKFYLGEVGNGASMKLVVNMIMGSMMAAFSEGLLLGEKIGLDPDVIIEVGGFPGCHKCPDVLHERPSMVQSAYPTAFPLKHQQKVRSASPVQGGQVLGLSDQDFSAVIEALKTKAQQQQ
ncbi:unnamed protein product [Spirodela intermedia]|uniref:Uncharacterized protein n=1 Tax=Spirodela intermedia TaxID=51605 RepID=A0A7I8J7X3_SPIIN|nr:unnamed protein product [Spirodela intermedia]CAA6666150.1 unnamed protein product [Spirodela intermedia]